MEKYVAHPFIPGEINLFSRKVTLCWPDASWHSDLSQKRCLPCAVCRKAHSQSSLWKILVVPVTEFECYRILFPSHVLWSAKGKPTIKSPHAKARLQPDRKSCNVARRGPHRGSGFKGQGRASRAAAAHSVQGFSESVVPPSAWSKCPPGCEHGSRHEVHSEEAVGMAGDRQPRLHLWA